MADCECPGPGNCPRYGIPQTAYAHAVCQGKHGSHMQLRYQAKWARRKGLPVVAEPKAKPTPRRPSSGVGTRLKELLAAAGVTLKGCNCRSNIARFDLETVEYLRDRTPQILAWLRQVSERDEWPQLDLPAILESALTPAPRSTSAPGP